MTILVGLLGAARAGKSTIASHLVEHYGAKKYSLADPLKDMVRNAFDLTEAQVRGSQASKEAIDPRYNVSPRFLMQRIGTEGGRKTFGANFWIDRCFEKIRAEAPALAVIDDVRFINESAAISARDGYVLRVESPGLETAMGAAHASESEWLEASYDYRIKPYARGLEDLLLLADAACEHFNIRRTR